MLLRICLVAAILAGLGVIGVSQFKVRPHIQGIIGERNENKRQWDEWEGRARKLTKELTETKETLETTKTKLAESETQRAQAEASLTEAQRRIASLQQTLDSTKAELLSTQQELSQWRLIGLTPEQIKNVVDSEKKLRADKEALAEENRLFAGQIRRLEDRIRILLGEDPEAIQPLPPGTKGKVLVVDPKWSFVVLDIGEKEQIRPNGVLLVHRNGKLIAKVRIVSVQGARSIANVMPGWKLDEIMEGDAVYYYR